MRLFILVFLLFRSVQLLAQDPCIDGRYDMEPLFNESDIMVNDNIAYGTALNENGALQNLLLDIYQPSAPADTLSIRPLMIFSHGGGLLGGDKTNPIPIYMCMELARRGYVTASINYRLGWLEIGKCEGDTASLSRARFRAQQDLHAAIRYLKANALVFGIDTNHIFLAGTSIGATMSMQAAYSLESDYDENLLEELGALDSSGNDLFDHSREIAGVIGTGVGIDDPAMLERYAIPVLYFHGTCDSTVPYIDAPLFYCFEPINYVHFYGSRYLADRMYDLGHPYWIYTNETGNHGAVDSSTALQQVVPFLRSILCQTIETKETYEYHVEGCIVSRVDSIKLELHPNPVGDELQLTIKSGATGQAIYEIFDLAGRRVYYGEGTFNAPIGERILSLPPAMDERSVYLLRVRINDSVGRVTFMKG